MKKYSQTKKIESQLTKLSNKIRKKYFPGLISLPVELNSRLTTCLARIFIPDLFLVGKIEIRTSYYNSADLKQLKETLKHEYIHYQLFVEGKPHGHSLAFAKVSKKMGLKEEKKYNHFAKYTVKCLDCKASWWGNKKKELYTACPYCKGENIRIRKRKI